MDQVLEAALRRKPKAVLAVRWLGGGGKKRRGPSRSPARPGFPAEQPPAIASTRQPRARHIPEQVPLPMPGLGG